MAIKVQLSCPSTKLESKVVHMLSGYKSSLHWGGIVWDEFELHISFSFKTLKEDFE